WYSGDPAMHNGIYTLNDLVAGDARTNSFICNNNISRVENGILSSRYGGYSKLNHFFECGNGHYSSDGDRMHLLFSVIDNCELSGVFAYHASNDVPTPIVDMSGLHHSNPTLADLQGLNT